MRKAVVLLSTAFLASCASSNLLKKPDALVTQCEPAILENVGDSVRFTVTCRIAPGIMDKKAQAVVYPELKYAGKTLTLDSVVVKGEKFEGPGQVISLEKGGKLTVSRSFAYTDGMESAELVARPIIRFKKKKMEVPARKLADATIITAENLDKTGFVYYQKPEIQDSLFDYSASIYFLKDQSDIRNSEKKRKEVAEMVKMLSTQLDIREVLLKAFASPDGELDRNSKLADERAENANQFIYEILKKKKVDKADQDGFLKDVKTAEDWAGLQAAVENSKHPQKEAVLRILKSELNEDGREAALRLNKPAFNWLAAEILPKLRRTEVVIRAAKLEKTLSELLGLAIAKPEELTEAECMKAAILCNDTADLITIYKNILARNPQNEIANLNLSALYIRKMEFPDALNIIQSALKFWPENEKFWQHKGLAEYALADKTEARKSWEKALSISSDNTTNISLAWIQAGEYNKAVQYSSANQNEYNRILALILNKDWDKAGKAIENAEKKPEIFYLRAILAARTGNKDLLATSLTRAISLNAKLREKASQDAEFASFRNQDFFKIAIR